MTDDVPDRAPTAGERIPISSVPNMRDLGGWPTADGGRVRKGLVYRSTELAKLDGDDLNAFAALGIRSVYDLRTEAERAAQPDRVPRGTQHVVVDVLSDSADAAPARLLEVLTDPAAARELLGDGKAMALFDHGYREIVRLPSALAAYRRLFSDLSEAAHRPALFHCTTGKDRTGWAAAALLRFVGVSHDDVLQDYLLTNEQLLPALQPIMDRFQAAGGDPDLLRPVLGVQREYLEAAFDEAHKQFGSLEGYFADGLELDAAARDALRVTFVDASSDG